MNGAVHAWDEWWAFYVGSLEDGSQESGEVDGEGKGYGPYILAEKRSTPQPPQSPVTLNPQPSTLTGRHRSGRTTRLYQMEASHGSTGTSSSLLSLARGSSFTLSSPRHA